MMSYRPDKATPKQIETLYKILPCTAWPSIPAMSKLEAWRVIANHAASWRGDPATYKQEKLLRSWGLWQEGMTKGRACDLIEETIEAQETQGTAGMRPGSPQPPVSPPVPPPQGGTPLPQVQGYEWPLPPTGP